MSLINNKKSKIRDVFDVLGTGHTEEAFIKTFKDRYPSDWQKIIDRWEAGIPDMQEPDVYMKEMYRNHRKMAALVEKDAVNCQAEESRS